MREQARDKGRLQDIIDYSNNVIELIEGVSCDDLASRYIFTNIKVDNTPVNISFLALAMTKIYSKKSTDRNNRHFDCCLRTDSRPR